MFIGEKGDTICYRGVLKSLLGVESTPFVHSGIDLGDGWVAEWSGGANLTEKPRLRIRSKIDFIASAPEGETIFVKKHEGTVHSPDEIVMFALHYVENPDDFNQYHFLKNNCQHFCTLCTTGRLTSWQTDSVFTLAKLVLGLL